MPRSWMSRNRRIRKHIRPGAIREIERCRAEGMKVVLASASFKPVTTTIVEASLFSTVRYRPSWGRKRMAITRDGSCPGVPVQGREKLRLLVQLCDDKFLSHTGCSSAHSDHYSDVPMLEHAKEVIVVDPDKKLKRIAERRGWKLLTGIRNDGRVAREARRIHRESRPGVADASSLRLALAQHFRSVCDPAFRNLCCFKQTQVARVLGRWEQWLEASPTVADLATAPLPPVLELWQGMGYNRRALSLQALRRGSRRHIRRRDSTRQEGTARLAGHRALDICGCAHICISAA